MLFNSYEFILLFLPVTWLLYYTFRGRWGFRAGASVLVLASLFFYGWWYPPYLALVLVSMFVNFNIGRLIPRLTDYKKRKKLVLVAGFSFNLLLLGYFKYANFFIENMSGLLGLDIVSPGILLPIGISFYTFQQIAYLADVYQKDVKYSATNYALFVCFFPQLIAGPIVHHRDVMPQFMRADREGYDPRDMALGIFIFVTGLFKKVMVADNLAHFANPVFDAADSGVMITMLEAWGGSLAYGLQLYFDFSGYSDMAIGLGLMFGIKLPLNFNSPYKAASIIEFWRRWHMTLSRFLRDYLYIPLGGNRKGKSRRYVNLLVTMSLGGIWHGAGWNFLIWGFLHGLYLSANQFFLHLRGKGLVPSLPGRTGLILATALTFVVVTVAWVPFRATTMDGTVGIWSAMVGGTAVGLPEYLIGKLGLGAIADGGFGAYLAGSHVIELRDWALTGFPLISLALMVALFAPNSLQLARYLPDQLPGAHEWLCFRPGKRWAVIAAIILLISLDSLNRVSEFMYFQF